MSEANPPPSQMVTELQVSAHLMQLDAGVYCVYHRPGSAPPDPATGLPGARLTLPPGSSGQGVTITGFREDGWLGTLDAAALIRVAQGPAQVLMTVYQMPDSGQAAPHLQVTKLVEGVQAAAPRPAPPKPPEPSGPPPEPVENPEIAAHVQLHGDVLARLGDWVGEPGSQRWIEGFALSPKREEVPVEEIEYQAVLGRGWLSPWAQGGDFCGSRGMALPILGLRVRLRGNAADTQTLQLTATFTDGTEVGPVGPGEACEAESLAPLEAFRIEMVPLAAPAPAARRAKAPALAAKPAPAPAAKRKAVPPPPPVPAAKRAAKRAAKPAAAPPPPLKGRAAAPKQGRSR